MQADLHTPPTEPAGETLAGLSPAGDKDEFFYLNAINKASLLMHVASGFVPEDKVRAYAQAIDTVAQQGQRTDRVIELEPQLIRIAGAEITQLHVGRSSQDMHATYRLAMLRDDVLVVHAKLVDLIEVVSTMAERTREVMVPNYTNGVAAQPNSLGHYLLGMSEGWMRDIQRLEQLYVRANLSPMGCAVLNGSGWPLQRGPMAAHLGFDGIVVNAFDATQVATVDLPLEFAHVVQAIALHASTFIADVMVQYAQSRPWMLLADSADTTYVSSAMPQKRNPGLLNNTRAQASLLAASAVGMAFLVHNAPSGMQDAKNVGTRREMVRQTQAVMANLMKIVAHLRVDAKRATEELNRDWTATQEVADVLMRRYQVPFRIGHHAASAMGHCQKFNPLKLKGILACFMPKMDAKMGYLCYN